MKASAVYAPTPTGVLNGRGLCRLLQGTEFAESFKKMISPARAKLVLLIDKKKDLLLPMNKMRKQIADEGATTISRMLSEPSYMAEMLKIRGIPAMGFLASNTEQALKMAPPSALRSAVDMFADDILDEAYRQASEIFGRG